MKALAHMDIDMVALREALEASWDSKTSYLAVSQKGNPALGQCYPTSRVIQFFFPDVEIVEGEVWNGKEVEVHFWTVLNVGGAQYHIDFTWQQFPAGSSVRSFKIRDREHLDDGPDATRRCELLRTRVIEYLTKKSDKPA